MPRQDFYLTFGSDAEEFAGRLANDLAGARTELDEFRKEAFKLEAELNRVGGRGQFTHVIATIGEVNSVLQEMLGHLQSMKGEFSELAGVLKNVGKAAASAPASTGRPAPGTPGVETSHAGRVSPSAQADAGRVNEISADVQTLVQTLLRNREALARANEQFEKAVSRTDKTKYSGQQRQYKEKIQATIQQLIADHELNVEEIELLEQREFEKAAAATKPKKRSRRKTTTRKKTTARKQEAEEEARSERREQERLAEEEQKAVEEAARPTEMKKKTTTRKATKKVTAKTEQAVKAIKEREKAVVEQVEESAAAVEAAERSLEENQQHVQQLRVERRTLAYQPGVGKKMVAHKEKDQPRVDEIAQEIADMQPVIQSQMAAREAGESAAEATAATAQAVEAEVQSVKADQEELTRYMEEREQLENKRRELATQLKSGPREGQWQAKPGQKDAFAAVRERITELDQIIAAELPPGATVTYGEDAPAAAPTTTADEVVKVVQEEGRKTKRTVESVIEARALVQEEAEKAFEELKESAKRLDDMEYHELSDRQKEVYDAFRAAGGRLEPSAERLPAQPDPSFLVDPSSGVAPGMLAVRDVLGEDVRGLQQLVEFLQKELNAPNAPTEDLQAYIADAEQLLAERQQSFTRVDRSQFARGLDIIGMTDEALEAYVPQLEAQAEALSQFIAEIDGGDYDAMGQEALGQLRGEVVDERRAIRDEKRRALDARRDLVNELIDSFPIEALSGLDQGALQLPESLQRGFSQFMQERGEPLPSAPVRRLLGEATSIQRLPEKVMKGAVGATGGQEHDPLLMLSRMPAYAPGQADQFREMLRQQEEVAENNRRIADQRMQEGTEAMSQILEVMPELSLSEIKTILGKATGISKQARNSLLAAVRFLDELAEIDPQQFSAARVSGAVARQDQRWRTRPRSEDRIAQLRRQVGDTDRLRRKQKTRVNKRDLQGAFFEAMYGERQVAGESRGVTERMFRLFDEGGLEGLASRARTPQQQQALKLFQDVVQEGLGRAVTTPAIPGTTRDPETGAIRMPELDKQLTEADSEQERERIQKLIDRKKEIEKAETAWIKEVERRWEDLQLALSGQLDPEAQERIEQLAREKADRRAAREAVGLPPEPPAIRKFRTPREGELAERMGVHRERADEAEIAAAAENLERARTALQELRSQEEGFKNDVEQRREAYERTAREAEEAQRALSEAERAPAQPSERTAELASQYEKIAEFERESLRRQQQGERILKPELSAFAKDVGVTGVSRMTKDEISSAISARKSEIGRERALSEREDERAKVIPPELVQNLEDTGEAASRAEQELKAAERALIDLFERLREAVGAESGRDRLLMQARSQDRVGVPERVLEFERLNDLIGRIESQEITKPEQIDRRIRDDYGLSDDLETSLRSLQQRRLGMMQDQMSDYMDFDRTDPRFSDPTVTPQEFFARFDEWAREVVESGRTPEEAAREDLQRREAEEQKLHPELAKAMERVQKERESEESRRQRPSTMGDCCERIVSILERIHGRLVAGLRVTGQSPGGQKGMTRAEMVDVARAGGVRGYSNMRKAELKEALESAGLLEKAERELANARQQVADESARLTPETLRTIQREELPERAQEFLGGDLSGDKVDNAVQLVGLLKEAGYYQDEASRAARTQLGLSEEQAAQLRERLTAIRAAGRGATDNEADANQERQEGARLLQEQLDILNMLSPSTQELVNRARELNQAHREGKATAEQTKEANVLAVEAMEREMSQFRDPGGRVALTGSERNIQQQALLGLDRAQFNDADARRKARQFRDTMSTAIRAEAPQFQDTLSSAFFGESGFMSRVMRSTGTFLVRNLTAGFVFGATRMIRTLLREAIQTEAQFIRVSDALEATGRSALGVRTELMRISVDIGRPLEEVYEIASNITGAFDDVRDVEFGTRIVAQLELISGGALSAKDGFDALQTIAAAFDLEGVRELERIQDTAVAIQNVMAIGIDDTIQGIGGLAGIAAEMNFELEQTAVLVAAVSKGTNQSGRAAAEQFGRILSTFETARGRNVLLEAGVGDRGLFQEGNVGAIVLDMIENWDKLTEAQQSNIKATFGSRREARAFNALINRREQILQTLIETENAYGLGQQRVAEVMREIANQVKIAGTNFTNFGAVLVRSGAANFFGVMLRSFNAAMGQVNEFLSVLNDLADTNPLTRFAREATGVLMGLALTMRFVSLSMDRMAASVATQAARDGSLAAISQTSFMGRRVHRAATTAGAGQAAGAAGVAGGGAGRGMLAGAMLGSMTGRGVPRGRTRMLPDGGVRVGRTTMSHQEAVNAGLIDPVTGLLIGYGLRGAPQRAAQGLGRGMQRAGARMAGWGAASTRTGAAMSSMGTSLTQIGSAAAWKAAGVIGAVAAAIWSLKRAADNVGDREDAAMDLLVPLMSDRAREEFEEARREENLGLLRRRTKSGREARDQQMRARKAELQDMLPGERLIAETLDARDFNDAFSEWVSASRPGEMFGINWGTIEWRKWFTGDAFENYVPVQRGSFEDAVTEMYERELSRLAEELTFGTHITGVPEAARRNLGQFMEEMEEIISIDDDGVISVQDVRWLTENREGRLSQIARIRGEVEQTITDQADQLMRMRESGDINDGDLTAANAALADVRNNVMRQLDLLERQALGLHDINQLTAEQLQNFIDAMSTIEGITIPQMVAIPEVRGALDLLFDDLVDEDSSWQRILDAIISDELSNFERMEEIQRARRDVLNEAERQYLEATRNPNTPEEDLEDARQRLTQAVQAVTQGQQSLWDEAASIASDMAQIAVEMGGDSIAVAEAAIESAERSIREQMTAMPRDSVEYFRALRDLRNIQRDRANIETAPIQRALELLQARGGDEFEVAAGELQAAQQMFAIMEQYAQDLDPADRAAFLQQAMLEVIRAEQGLAAAIESRAESLVSLLQAQTENPLEQAQIGLSAALSAQERAYARNERDVATLRRLEEQVIQERRRVADAIENIRRSEMELGLSQTRDPRERALIELREAIAAQAFYQGDDPTELNARQAAANNARNAMLDAIRADRDAVAQTQIAMERDPEVALLMEMQLARVQLAEAAEQGTAAYEAARQNLVRLEQALEDQRNQIRLQQFSLRIATTEDPVRQAQYQIERAREEMRQAVGQLERTAAHESILAARRTEAEAISAVAQSQLDLASAIAQAQGDQVRVAQIQLEAARMRLREAQRRGEGDAAIAQARAQIIQAEAGIRDAVLQDHLDTIDFNREMGVITQGQAIQAMQTILQEMELTRDQRRNLLRQIKGLQDDLRAQLTASGFNIPTEIDLPTAYMVRRSLGLDEIDRDSVPDEWRELTLARVDIDEDLTKPLSTFTDAVSGTNDEVVRLVREGADAAIDTILAEYAKLGPLMDNSLTSLARAQSDAWDAAEKTAGTGARRTNSLSLAVISELPPAMQSELARIESDQAQLWTNVNSIAQGGVRDLNSMLAGELSDGVNVVAQISHGFMVGIAAGIEPLLEMLGLGKLTLPSAPPRIGGGGGGVSRVAARGGLTTDDRYGLDTLPGSARIEQPHGNTGLVQWAEQSTHGEAFIPLAPANRPRSIDIWKETGRRLGVDLQEFRVGGFTSRDISRARSFAMNQAGKPYLWGGVGPRGYDCSGIWSAVVNKLNNATNPHQRQFATASFTGTPPAGFARGLGLVSVGVVQGSPGHMSGTLAGLDIESRGSRGVLVGNEARGATDSLYPAQYYLTKGGGGEFADEWFNLPDMPTFPDTHLGAVGEMIAFEVRRRVQEALRDKFKEAFGFSDIFGSFGGSENESGTLQGMVKRALAERGWNDHWPALNRLIQAESSWNPNAQNPNSSAYGLFQFLDSTWAGTGIPKTGDPRMQIEAGLRYIANRYGNPTRAWQHWMARVPINGQDMGHWYRQGGIFDSPQMIGVGEAGPEAVIPLDRRGARFLSQLLDETAIRAAVRSGGGDDIQAFLRDLGKAAIANSTTNNGGDTQVSIENTFNQTVQSPVQIQQIAQAVVDLLGKQMSGSARSSMITPHLVRT